MADGKAQQRRGGDWTLRALVYIVEAIEEAGANVGLPVTLNASGSLVSGYIVGQKAYLDDFAAIIEDGLESGFGSEQAQRLAEPFRVVGRSGESSPDDKNDEFHAEHTRYRYIHLREARFVHPNGGFLPETEGMMWRSPIEAIDGFTLGAFVPTEDD